MPQATLTFTETGNIAMPLELSDLVAHNDGNEEEVKQLVSQWMCDICRDFTTPQFSNPVVTQCFLCNAFLCKSCAQSVLACGSVHGRQLLGLLLLGVTLRWLCALGRP